MGQLSEVQLRRLEVHKYSCASTSLMDPMMQKWWCWLVEQCPLTLAPNLITITGLLINIITSLLLVYYSPDAKQEVGLCVETCTTHPVLLVSFVSVIEFLR